MTAQPVYNVEVYDHSGVVIQHALTRTELEEFELNHLDDDLDYMIIMLSNHS